MSDEPRADERGEPRPDAAGGEPRREVPRGTMSMADYREAMTERNIHARNRGLAGPFIEGGRDPDPEAGLREERRYLRLLLAMVLLIVVGGLLLAIVGYLLTGGAGFGAG